MEFNSGFKGLNKLITTYVLTKTWLRAFLLWRTSLYHSGFESCHGLSLHAVLR